METRFSVVPPHEHKAAKAAAGAKRLFKEILFQWTLAKNPLLCFFSCDSLKFEVDLACKYTHLRYYTHNGCYLNFWWFSGNFILFKSLEIGDFSTSFGFFGEPWRPCFAPYCIKYWQIKKARSEVEPLALGRVLVLKQHLLLWLRSGCHHTVFLVQIHPAASFFSQRSLTNPL